jgi:hypothetical protein
MNIIQNKKHEQIANLIRQGIECWTQAGEVLCEILDAGESLSSISEAAEIPYNVLCQLERIGRKQVIPQLLLSEFPAARAIERLPYSEQVRLQADPVEIVVSGGDVLKVKPSEMTRHQVKQAFASDHCRTLSEQKAWLVDQTPAPVASKEIASYRIRGNKVFFPAPCEMTRSTLARIIAEMD